MNKIISSGLILLTSAGITAYDTKKAFKSPKFLVLSAGMAAVTYGIYDWHMGIIKKYKKQQEQEEQEQKKELK